MRNNTITCGQKKCLDVIKSYIDVHGYAPSIREIGNMTGYKSTSTVHMYMKELFKGGYLESEAEEGASRAFRLGEKAKETT